LPIKADQRHLIQHISINQRPTSYNNQQQQRSSTATSVKLSDNDNNMASSPVTIEVSLICFLFFS
jgi:hypothetical protein